jgi:uncharacterized protein
VALPPLVSLPDAVWLAQHIAEARHVYATGDFVEALAFRFTEIGAIAPLEVDVFPRTLGLFLLGAFIWRTGVLQRAADKRALLLGAASAALIATFLAPSPALQAITLALAYGALVIWGMTTRFGTALLGWAAPLGRMAFTNYLAQSLIFGGIFYGYGLGLFGRLGVATALGIGVVVYAAQAIFSHWWLSRHYFGPVEWLWRRLMYGVPQPMRLLQVPA